MIELVEGSRAELADDLAAGVRALLADAFPKVSATQAAYYAANGTPSTVVIVRDDRRAIGHVAIHTRQVNIGSEVLQIGMLGGVAVAPDFRRRGHCRALVQRAHAFLRDRSIPFSILFAFEPRVYESNGYKLMQNETRFLDFDGAWKTLVYRGSMYAELAQKRWPDQLIDLCGRTV
jgi:predicted acetyltransferase